MKSASLDCLGNILNGHIYSHVVADIVTEMANTVPSETATAYDYAWMFKGECNMLLTTSTTSKYWYFFISKGQVIKSFNRDPENRPDYIMYLKVGCYLHGYNINPRIK